MHKNTTIKNGKRKYKNKSRRRRHKGGGIIHNLLKLNRIVMPDDTSQRLLDNAISIVEKRPKYVLKVFKIFKQYKKTCDNKPYNIETDYDIERLICIYEIISKNISKEEEQDIKDILVNFIKNNYNDIQTLLKQHNINGLDFILLDPEIIYKIDRSFIEDIIYDNE